METRPTGTAVCLSCMSESCNSSLTALNKCFPTAQVLYEQQVLLCEGPSSDLYSHEVPVLCSGSLARAVCDSCTVATALACSVSPVTEWVGCCADVVAYRPTAMCSMTHCGPLWQLMRV